MSSSKAHCEGTHTTILSKSAITCMNSCTQGQAGCKSGGLPLHLAISLTLCWTSITIIKASTRSAVQTTGCR